MGPTLITENLFIAPGVDLQKEEPSLYDSLLTVVNFKKEDLRERWRSSEGRRILAQWKGSGFDRGTLDSLVGRYYGQTDLRGIPLINEDLQNAELNHVDFYGSILTGANLSGANLSDSWLSESIILSAKFNWANMSGALLDNVEFNSYTDFLGVNLEKVNFNLAALLKEQAIAQQRIENLKKNIQH
ncbi:MAG: pentapeptide repeat-containing protein [Leptolyngbyaceae cyanobacterium]